MNASQHNSRFGFLYPTFIAVAVIAILVLGTWFYARWSTGRHRAKWKVHAVERLAAESFTNTAVLKEIDELKADTNGFWTGRHVLVMTNGEKILFEYLHGQSDYFPPHLFLGRCSDGRWLYSSYHFCNAMTMVHVDPAPGSITEFATRYAAREFDGKSDESLKPTDF